MQIKKLINEDPLNSTKRFAGLGNYETPLYSKKIYTPADNETSLFLKHVAGLDIFCTILSAGKVFQNIVDKGDTSWSYFPAVYVLEELKKGKNFDWYELCLQCTKETGTYPKDWTEKELHNYIIKSENIAVQGNAIKLKRILMENVCCSGELIIKVSKTGEYLKQIEYKGEGFQADELCGGGGITFYAQEVPICHYQTWVS